MTDPLVAHLLATIERLEAELAELYRERPRTRIGRKLERLERIQGYTGKDKGPR
jgi:hypothetical protein